ncbi:MAG: hypothetical protein NW224_23750 [Leptolyngbyaceae cyanobacterium bins.302]|nr:hypothetical protein [Leptolyngbyaceae cyanobacterium bins.302]
MPTTYTPVAPDSDSPYHARPESAKALAMSQSPNTEPPDATRAYP